MTERRPWTLGELAALPQASQITRARYVSFHCGFKNPKHIVAIEVTNVYPGEFWEDYGYNWFSAS